ncbi:enoyl-CoA hydratase/isomerase family protein [Aeromicrobium sp.]|uniref:enoyl-CoA hydratase/isomerase family protein n=1 Tax=Aeromicrobium sp. TaxID=1871063 RepID=UPI0025BB64AA|nr:enoyl-CoA hydratase/isomerase family protein [Aeromicrobium sp.]MCK5892602.1 enoyl-CoA hydratase/isomerase family protein [Aeromicrobium sp.]
MPEHSSPDVVTEAVGRHVARIVFDRRAAANALLPETAVAIEQALRALQADPDVRVVQLRGAGGRVFCGGFDLSGVTTGVRDVELQSLLTALRTSPVPTVAVLDGHAVGAGLDLAASCDLRIARTGSRIGLPATRIGVAYHPVGLRRMVQMVPALRRVLLTGEVVPIESVAGFADGIATPEELDALVDETCRAIVAGAPTSVTYMAAMIRPTDVLDVDTAIAWRDHILDGPDPAESAAARAAGRDPQYAARRPWKAPA